MTTSQRRIALLTGASISALGLASPAFAAPHYPLAAPHDAVADGAYSGTSNPFVGGSPTDTIDICTIAVDPQCFLGVVDTGPTPTTANVNSVPTGQIVQDANAPTGPVNFTVGVGVGDFAEIGAFASGSGTFLTPVSAQVHTAISQNVTGALDIVNLTVDNNGHLLIDALAISTTSDAHASAFASNVIFQTAVSNGGDVTLNVVNDGTMTLAATAVANGGGHANAIATISSAISQNASANGGLRNSPAVSSSGLPSPARWCSSRSWC